MKNKTVIKPLAILIGTYLLLVIILPATLNWWQGYYGIYWSDNQGYAGNYVVINDIKPIIANTIISVIVFYMICNRIKKKEFLDADNVKKVIMIFIIVTSVIQITNIACRGIYINNYSRATKDAYNQQVETYERITSPEFARETNISRSDLKDYIEDYKMILNEMEKVQEMSKTIVQYANNFLLLYLLEGIIVCTTVYIVLNKYKEDK